MLNITRKEGQRIVLGDGSIVIEISEIRGKWVQIGIQAPPEMRIFREEVFLRIKEEEKEAKK